MNSYCMCYKLPKIDTWQELNLFTINFFVVIREKQLKKTIPIERLNISNKIRAIASSDWSISSA